MAESAGADLLTVVRRLLDFPAAKTQQVADGAGRSSSSSKCGLTNRVRLPLLARESILCTWVIILPAVAPSSPYRRLSLATPADLVLLASLRFAVCLRAC